jgi:hypothetical protein
MANGRTVAAMIVGAVFGGLTGYLFFTESGQFLRRKLEPVIDDVSGQLKSFRYTVENAATVASEGSKLLHEAMADAGGSSSRYTTAH